jgi:hypothetical protein
MGGEYKAEPKQEPKNDGLDYLREATEKRKSLAEVLKKTYAFSSGSSFKEETQAAKDWFVRLVDETFEDKSKWAYAVSIFVDKLKKKVRKHEQSRNG